MAGTTVTIEVPTQYRYCQGDSVKAYVYIDPPPTANATFKIFRRRASVTKDVTSDVLITSAELTCDASGFAVATWIMTETAFSGPRFRYYPAVLNNDDSNTTVLADAYDWTIYSSIEYLFEQIDAALGPVQAIPVYHEISKESPDTFTFPFTYKNWRDDYPPLVLQVDGATPGGTQITISGASPDAVVSYQEGQVVFDGAQSDIVELDASYVFRFFDEFALRTFANRTLSQLNMLPPLTGFTLDAYPSYWDGLLVYGTCLNALDMLMVSTIFQEKKVIFADNDVVAALSGYYTRLQTAFAEGSKKAKRWSMVSPRGITGHDVVAPPRVNGHNWMNWVYLRGSAL